MKKIWLFQLLILLGLMNVQCAIPFKSPAETNYFNIKYPYIETDCTGQVQNIIKIRSFTENIPYNRNEMVVLGPERRVTPSSKNRWVGNPGNMITQNLTQDFSRDPLFYRVVDTGDSSLSPLELNGRIIEFAWVEENSLARARLNVEVNIINHDDGKVMFTRSYHYLSSPLPREMPEKFAEAMSDLVHRFSLSLRHDICSAMKGEEW